MYTNIKIKIAIALCALTLMLAFQPVSAEKRTHEVKQGETLYRISNLYNVTIEELQRANPGVISGNRVPAGAIIVIPDAADAEAETVEAEAAETPVAEAVAAETEQVPVKTVSQRVNEWLGSIYQPVGRDYKTLAVILPFNLASQNVKEDKLQMRSVEFYQGVLLAVNRAQLNGVKVCLQTYDLGTESLQDILSREELLKADLIVSPMEPDQIREVAKFGEEHGINVINPFKLVPDLSQTHTHLFQLNTLTSDLYPELSAELLSRFDNYAFVFVSDSMFLAQRDPYAEYLKRELKAADVPYYEYTYTTSESVGNIESELHLEESNVFYVLDTNHKDALRRFFPSLKNLKFLKEHPEVAIAAIREENPEKADRMEASLKARRAAQASDSLYVAPQMAVLGYPDWQLYTSEYMEHFFDTNVWMFSKFYVDPFDADVLEVQGWFRYWYGREMLDLVPKYGFLGYDVAAYGLQMLGNYGHNFDLEAEGKYIKTLQNAMLFRRQGEGAFLNRGLYLVHFTPESKIEKYEVK